MTIHEIKKLIKGRAFPDQPKHIELKETHSAWVLLSEQYVYKIKKPVLYSFLDFSTLALRRFYCEQELVLNQRLAPSIYLKVLPVKSKNDQVYIGESEGETIDYCLLMKRMDSTREMNKLLKKDLVQENEVRAIAQQLAAFHKNATVVDTPFKVALLKAAFADILSVTNIIRDHCSETADQTIKEAVVFANKFIDQHLPRLTWRQQKGYVRDVHGDLHSGNIFLLEEPVIFDCIEFSESFRQIDLLNEIAFLCMDLDYHGKPKLGDAFLETYLSYFPCLFNSEDRQIFSYYKWYRAGIRLKVYCLGLHDGLEKNGKEKAINRIRKYYYLFAKYFEEMKNPKYISFLKNT